MAHDSDSLILDTPGAPIMGATAVPGTLKMIKVDADGRLITVPSTVVTTAQNLRTFRDTNFTVTISLDLNAVLSENAETYRIENQGVNAFTFATSKNGIAFGDEVNLEVGGFREDSGTDVDTIRITHSANSAYQVDYR